MCTARGFCVLYSSSAFSFITTFDGTFPSSAVHRRSIFGTLASKDDSAQQTTLTPHAPLTFLPSSDRRSPAPACLPRRPSPPVAAHDARPRAHRGARRGRRVCAVRIPRREPAADRVRRDADRVAGRRASAVHHCHREEPPPRSRTDVTARVPHRDQHLRPGRVPQLDRGQDVVRPALCVRCPWWSLTPPDPAGATVAFILSDSTGFAVSIANPSRKLTPLPDRWRVPAVHCRAPQKGRHMRRRLEQPPLPVRHDAVHRIRQCESEAW